MDITISSSSSRSSQGLFASSYKMYNLRFGILSYYYFPSLSSSPVLLLAAYKRPSPALIFLCLIILLSLGAARFVSSFSVLLLLLFREISEAPPCPCPPFGDPALICRVPKSFVSSSSSPSSSTLCVRLLWKENERRYFSFLFFVSFPPTNSRPSSSVVVDRFLCFFFLEISKADNKKKTERREKNIKKGKSIVNGKQLGLLFFFGGCARRTRTAGDFTSLFRNLSGPPPRAPESSICNHFAPKSHCNHPSKSACIEAQKPVRRMPQTSKKRALPSLLAVPPPRLSRNERWKHV